MSVVAGFKCKNGVVICADTEHTGGVGTFDAPKLWTDKDRVVVAGAGWDDYIKAAVDDLSERFEHLQSWSSGSVRKTIEDVVTHSHRAIHNAYSITDPSRPTLFLMVGVRLDDFTTMLVKAAETAILVVQEFDFVGSGQDIARLLVSPFYDSELSVTEMDVIMAYCFRFAKASGVFCGGDTHIGILFDGPAEVEYAHPAYLKRDKEVVIGHILGELAPVLSACWNLQVKPDEFNERVEKLVEWLRSQRKRQEDAKGERRIT